MRIITGGADSYSTMVYGAPSAQALSMFRDNYNSYISNMQMIGNDVSAAMMQRTVDIWERTNSVNAIDRTQAILELSGHARDRNDIYRCETLEDLQVAGTVMQRYLMADPMVRRLYIDQEIDGYSGSYVDLQPGAIGLDHDDYRRITNGMVIDLPEKDGGGWIARNFWDFDPTEEELPSFRKKAHVANAWDLQAYYMDLMEDTTSKHGDRR